MDIIVDFVNPQILLIILPINNVPPFYSLKLLVQGTFKIQRAVF